MKTMLNFGKLTNEELINLLAVTKGPTTAASDEQIEKWNCLFDEAADQLKERLKKEKEID